MHSSGNAMHVIDEEDAAIHQGESYHFGKKIFLPPAGVAMLSGTTGSARKVHFQNLSIAATNGPIEISFYRDSTVQSGSGTIETPINRRFDITSSSQMIVRSGVTLTTTGTAVVLGANLATSTLGNNTNPSESGFFHGFVLNYNTTSAIGLRNTAVDTATIWANFAFHEPRYL